MDRNALDWGKIYAAAQRASAVYETDKAKALQAFIKLNCSSLSYFSDDVAQGMVGLCPDGIWEITIAGTRVSEGTVWQTVDDITQDAEEVFANHYLGGGAVVASGAWMRGQRLWVWAQQTLPLDVPVRVVGHSLGAQTTYAMLSIVPPSRYVDGIAFEGPKAGNAAFYAQYDSPKVLSVFNRQDFWAGHPLVSATLQHAPEPCLWLRDGIGSVVPAWPGPGYGRSAMQDHDVDRVVEQIARICAKSANTLPT